MWFCPYRSLFEGVKKSQNCVDVIYESPLISPAMMMTSVFVLANAAPTQLVLAQFLKNRNYELRFLRN